MSIRVKLFLAFLLTILLIVTSMHFFTRWSLEQGFTEFIEKRQQERIDKIIDVLEAYYADHRGWNTLAKNKQDWITLLWQVDPLRHRPPRRIMQLAQQEPANWWPPTLPETSTGKWIPFGLRVMLLDKDKSIIFGQEKLRVQLDLHPIYYEFQVVGFLGLLPGNPVSQASDIYFMEQQTKLFLWIAIGMIVLSALLAWFLAYHFGRPLKQIAAAAKQLATGDYKARLSVTANDEIGQLALNFNNMAAALEQAEQSRRRWVADISHELRTPLAILRGELEAVLDGVHPLNRDTIESLSSDVMRLNRLTEDLYQLALSDQGALSYRKELLNPIPLLQDDLAAFTADFEQKQIVVKWINQLFKPILINADAHRLSQLFRNLLANSLRHTDPEGRLEITVQRLKNQLMIELADSSPGITEQDAAHLFDRFYRIDPSRNRHLGGAGLGLAICSNIVSAHAGTLTAAPSALGGLLIRIQLPIAV